MSWAAHLNLISRTFAASVLSGLFVCLFVWSRWKFVKGFRKLNASGHKLSGKLCYCQGIGSLKILAQVLNNQEHQFVVPLDSLLSLIRAPPHHHRAIQPRQRNRREPLCDTSGRALGQAWLQDIPLVDDGRWYFILRKILGIVIIHEAGILFLINHSPLRHSLFQTGFSHPWHATYASPMSGRPGRRQVWQMHCSRWAKFAMKPAQLASISWWVWLGTQKNIKQSTRRHLVWILTREIWDTNGLPDILLHHFRGWNEAVECSNLHMKSQVKRSNKPEMSEEELGT